MSRRQLIGFWVISLLGALLFLLFVEMTSVLPSDRLTLARILGVFIAAISMAELVSLRRRR